MRLRQDELLTFPIQINKEKLGYFTEDAPQEYFIFLSGIPLRKIGRSFGV
jgi:hypothetical protein